ncbi:MAG: hypothetical protein IJX38_03945 [Clostridia bacterium]|nr:hypothetical protein [Clostridia bacterium]
MKKNKEEFKLRDLVRIFVPMWWVILIAAVLCAALMGVYSKFIKDTTYTSSVTFMVSKGNSATGSFNSSDRDLSTKMVETYEIVIKTESFGRILMESAESNEGYKQEWELSPGKILSSLSIKQEGETEMFTVDVTTTDPALSYFVASIVAEEVVIVHTADRQNWPYKNEIQSTVVNEPDNAIGAPNSKNVFRNSALAFVLGAVVAMVGIFIYSVFDVTIHNRKKIEDALDVPVLGVIPRFVSDEEGTKNEK